MEPNIELLEDMAANVPEAISLERGSHFLHELANDGTQRETVTGFFHRFATGDGAQHQHGTKRHYELCITSHVGVDSHQLRRFREKMRKTDPKNLTLEGVG